MRPMIEETGGLLRWAAALVLVGLVLIATILVVTAFFPGQNYANRLQTAYKVLWTETTRRQFTDIMREKPWLYLVPAGGLIFVVGWLLPQKYWGRAIFTFLVFGLGFVGGHVFA